MRTCIKKCLLFVALALEGTLAQAQVGPCPPGMSEYSSSNGIPACGPLHSNDNQPQGRWVDQWGAYAMGNDGTTGFSSSQVGEREAEQAAVSNCLSRAGKQCKVEMTYRNGCIAVIGSKSSDGSGSHNASSDATKEKAIKRAITVCEKEGGISCQVFRTECSPAKWIDDN